jgi:hypothetical protein
MDVFLKSRIKTVLQAVAPKPYKSFMAARWKKQNPELSPALSAYVDRHGLTVLAGPFAGMKYIAEAAGSALSPKLIGSYECELHEVLSKVLTTHYATVVDVGCAEGFYVVGLAIELKGNPTIYAFDTDPHARYLCNLLAKNNKVRQKMVISGFCDAQVLNQSLRGHSLVICDCEGYESELLAPSLSPALADADILVELHECFKPGVTKQIIDRFTASHNILLIDSTDRNPDAFPAVKLLEPRQQELLLMEMRPGAMQWAFMTPKSASQ